MASATKCAAPFFHVSIRNRPGEFLDRSQWLYAVDRIERILGLTGQPRAIAAHTAIETGDSHVHAAWSRITEHLTATPLPFWKTRIKQVCRELENRLGLAPVPDTRQSRIRFGPTRAEEEQSRRLGLDIHATRDLIRSSFESADCGGSFEAALDAAGLILARGERRDYLVVDQQGGFIALGKRVLDISAAQIRLRLKDLNGDTLPTLEEARKIQLGRQEKNFKTEELGPAAVSQTPIEAGEASQPTARFEDEAVAILQDPGKHPSEAMIDVAMALPITPETRAVASNHPVHDRPQPSSASKKLGHMLKEQFRKAVTALTARMPVPTIEKRRRRTGETVSCFRTVARRIVRPVTSSPFLIEALGFLRESAEWLHLWNWNNDSHQAPMGDFDNTDHNQPSHHL